MNGKGLSSSAGKKKLVINFNAATTIPDTFERDTWVKLQGAVRAVHEGRPVSSNLEELYNDVKSLCANQKAKSLFDSLRDELYQHIQTTMKSLTTTSQSDNETYLDQLDGVWQRHCEHMRMIRSIFLYLDRSYVLHSSPVRSLWNLGLDIFQEHFLGCRLSDKTISSLLSLIHSERTGEAVSRSLIQSLVRMLSSLDLYSSLFEGDFLTATEHFYRVEGDEKVESLDVALYLRHVERRLQEESDRLVYYLDPTTKKSLMAAVQRELLTRHLDSVLSKGFDKLMADNRADDLALFYRLSAHVDGGRTKMKDKLKEYIKSAGSRIVSDEEKDETMVQSILDLKQKLDNIIATSFAGNEDFAYALKDAFEFFINQRENKPAELVAKYVDEKLRAGGAKGVSEGEFESVLNRVLVIFRFINGKDVFEAFYKKDLAKRLLLGRSSSIDAEKLMISKLRTECGSAFTSKLEGMFKDVDLSKDIMASFKQSKGYATVGDVDLNVSVLTFGFWPPYPVFDVALPPLMAGYLESFKKFYLEKHSSRRLTWQHFLGTCVLKAQFPKGGKKELSVSLFQSLVLLLFNDAESLPYSAIKEKTGLDDKELKRTLQSLACGKIRPLSKSPMSRDVIESDTFLVNVDFKHQLFRIKINQIQVKETKAEREKTNDTVLQDRQYQIDAAVVRIMKTRKTLTHTLLMAELFKQLKFPIQAPVIKKRIESLIEREFMERDSDNAQVYNYVA